MQKKWGKLTIQSIPYRSSVVACSIVQYERTQVQIPADACCSYNLHIKIIMWFVEYRLAVQRNAYLTIPRHHFYNYSSFRLQIIGLITDFNGHTVYRIWYAHCINFGIIQINVTRQTSSLHANIKERVTRCCMLKLVMISIFSTNEYCQMPLFTVNVDARQERNSDYIINVFLKGHILQGRSSERKRNDSGMQAVWPTNLEPADQEG